jgi:hypothetical protein
VFLSLRAFVFSDLESVEFIVLSNKPKSQPIDQPGRQQEHDPNMADEAMAAPTSGAPPAATDHEFSSHQEQPINHVPMHNTSRKSTLSKSYLDVHVTGTQTPISGQRHMHSHLSHMGDIALENYFVCTNYPPEA